MELQEAYEGIKAHFSKPGAVFGWDEKEAQCVYRADRDPKSPIRCALGCLIPDDIYDSDVEGLGITSLGEYSPERKILDYFDINSEDFWKEDSLYNFLSLAQAAHDFRADPNGDLYEGGIEGFLEALDALAEDFGVNVEATQPN